MPVTKPKRLKLVCDLCNAVFDSDYRYTHNKKYHAELFNSKGFIAYHKYGAPMNPFVVSFLLFCCLEFRL